ncbi:hypothetical protein [Micromonospora chalcea]|uniref:hypothetical protein n=1 Tax=Micromonospora chalcea TaxID=1874 RepID=UPI00332FA3C3
MTQPSLDGGERLVPAAGRSSIAVGGDAAGGILSTGDYAINVQAGHINVTAGVVPARSSYRDYVKGIAPSSLEGRDVELAMLEDFCTAAEANTGFLWLQAGAWAGKTALLSWFVTHPPQGVRIISFFVTGRFARHNDRHAFLAVVLEQLAELLGEPSPAYLPEPTRDAHFLGLLGRAAECCRARGERLTLVIDGLDEDIGAGSQSIAGLLPGHLPPGTRVVLAGRKNPPLSSDVAEDHPLRDRAVTRPLERSPDAAVIGVEAKRELQQLLDGSPEEQALLGMLVASGGGLSAHDLSVLLQQPEWRVEDLLSTYASRMFDRRPSQWRTGTDLFILGHDELQRQAVEKIGAQRLRQYRGRIDGWAELYRESRWPSNTPEYLLTGYFQLLNDGADMERMVAYVIDVYRNRRVLTVTGSNAIVFSEISDAQHAICGHSDAELLALMRLAIRRDDLLWRSTHIPTSLPATWLKLGNPQRGEALADSIVRANDRCEAFLRLSRAFVSCNDMERSNAAVAKAAMVAEQIGDPALRAKAFAALGIVHNSRGDVDRAREILAEGERLAASVEKSSELSTTIDLEFLLEGHAREDLRYLTWSRLKSKPSALAHISRAYARIGDYEKAAKIAAEIGDFSYSADAAGGLVAALVDAHDYARASSLANAIAKTDDRMWAFYGLAIGLIKAGDKAAGQDSAEKLENLVRSENADGSDRVTGLMLMANLMDEFGKREEALQFLDEAVMYAEKFDQRYWMDWLQELASELGRKELANRIRRSVTDPELKLSMLAADAARRADAGDVDAGIRLAEQVEEMARSMNEPSRKLDLLDGIAEALEEADHYGQLDPIFALAARLAAGDGGGRRSMERWQRRQKGPDDHRLAWLAQREAIIASIPAPEGRARTLIGLAESAVLAADGEGGALLTRLAKEAIAEVSGRSERARLRQELQERAHPARARTLVASALREKALKDSFKVVATMEPQLLLEALADLVPSEDRNNQS